MNKNALVSLFTVALLIMTVLACVESEGSETSSRDIEEIDGNCTAFYVGKKVSADGTTLMGQTDDSSFADVSYQTHPDKDEAGRKIIGNTGFEYNLPEHTYGYTVFGSNRNDGNNHSGTGGINTQGLAYTGSITAVCNQKAISADPYIDGGMNEDCIGVLLCMCCDSARSAVDMLCEVIDEKGSTEEAIFILADKDEAWYFEAYTGHQYLAILLPDDKMATFGNEYNIIHVTEGKEYKASPGLKSIADDNGFAVYDEGKEHTIENLRIRDTYANQNVESAHLRTWRGHNLYDMTDPGDYDEHTHYQLLFTPNKMITVKNMMDFMRDRYEGTDYCPDTTGEMHRVIGIEKTLEAHVLQIHGNLPKEMSVTYWGCIAPAEFGVFLPFNMLTTEFYDAFAIVGKSTVADPNTMYGVTKEIHALGFAYKDKVKPVVRSYWDDLENYYITIYPLVLENASDILSESRNKAEKYITDYTVGLQKSAFEDANMFHDYIIDYIAKNISTITPMKSMPAMMDPVKYSERYGWTSEIEDGVITLRNGDDTMVVTDTSITQTSRCTVTFNGTVYEKVASYVWGDSYCIPMAVFAPLLSSHNPVIVIEERNSGGSDNNTGLYVAIGVLAVIAILAIILVAVRVKNN